MMLTAIRKRHLLGRIVIPIAVTAVACANASGGAYSINVDHNDPAAVIQVAVQTLFSWQPGADASPVSSVSISTLYDAPSGPSNAAGRACTAM